MWLPEPFPLPWDGVETEEMPEDDGVRPGMSDDDDPLVGVVECPEMAMLRLHRVNSVRVERLLEAGDNPMVEGAEALPARPAVPHLLHRPQRRLLEEPIDLLDRAALPICRVVDFLKPIVCFEVLGKLDRDGLRRLPCSVHRRTPQLVDTVKGYKSMCHSESLLTSEFGEVGIVACGPVRSPVGLSVTDEEEVHAQQPTYHDAVSRKALIEHLRKHALRTDGPFKLRSGAVSAWYLDARQTTFSGEGGSLVGAAVLEVLDSGAEAVGGMTIGADPIAVATAMTADRAGRDLQAFSIRKETKDHGTGGRLVGPVGPGTKAVILDDTTSTGAAAIEACEVAGAEGLEVIQAIALVDRSDGKAAANFAERGIPYVALITPDDLGVGG